MDNDTKRTKFLYQLIDFGIGRIVFSFDFIASAVIFVLMVLSNKYGWAYFPRERSLDFVVVMFAAASTLFSITLAALAIVLSFSSSQFVTFLKKKDKFSAILFPFWLGNASYLMVLLLSSLYLLLDISKISILDLYLFPLITALFFYSLVSTFFLLATVFRFGYFTNIDNKE